MGGGLRVGQRWHPYFWFGQLDRVVSPANSFIHLLIHSLIHPTHTITHLHILLTYMLSSGCQLLGIKP